jgi:GDP-4-dehydro-6-deoxy-D-mannose reductase
VKRALVTGHSGFTGVHLMSDLTSMGYAVSGFDRTDGGDIRDSVAIRNVISAVQPAVVFHLAASLKSEDPAELYSVNVLGTVALLEALSHLEAPPVVVIVGSSSVYSPSTGRVNEKTSTRPLTNYGASKLAQELVAMRYFGAHRMPVIRVRTFNLLGPGLPTSLACGSFAATISRLEQMKSPHPLRTGNLNATRDFTDVRDAVRAYRLLAERGRGGRVYNVCSGTPVSLRHCVDVLLRLAARPITSEVDPALLRGNDVDMQVGDFGRLHALTGWKPVIPIEQSLGDMLDYWRRRHER